MSKEDQELSERGRDYNAAPALNIDYQQQKRVATYQMSKYYL